MPGEHNHAFDARCDARLNRLERLIAPRGHDRQIHGSGDIRERATDRDAKRVRLFPGINGDEETFEIAGRQSCECLFAKGARTGRPKNRDRRRMKDRVERTGVSEGVVSDRVRHFPSDSRLILRAARRRPARRKSRG